MNIAHSILNSKTVVLEYSSSGFKIHCGKLFFK